MNHIFQTSVLLIRCNGCIELNWLCKHTKKIRTSQTDIPCTELSKTQLFPVSIVNFDDTCDWFYQGQTANLKQRIRKHKSDVFHPQSIFSKKCSEHWRDCRRMKEPFFRIYSFLYENIKELREFKEKISLWDRDHTSTLLNNKSLKYS